MQNPFIIGDNIYLRAIEAADCTVLAATENHPEIRQTLFYALPQNTEQVFQRWQKMERGHQNIVFTICSKQPDTPIGVTAFHRIDWIGRMAVFYIAIADENNRSQGYGSEVVRLMCDYAFKTLNLNRIQLHVAVENERAVKAYKKCGFQIEGTLRQAMYRDGRFFDFYVMGLLKEEY